MTLFLVGTIAFLVGFLAGVVLTLMFRIPVENRLKAEKAEILAGIKSKI